MTDERQPTPVRWIAGIAAVLAVALAAVAAALGAGWLFLIDIIAIPVLPIMAILHLVVELRALRIADTAAGLWWLLATDVLLVLAVLLRVDFGDASSG